MTVPRRVLRPLRIATVPSGRSSHTQRKSSLGAKEVCVGIGFWVGGGHPNTRGCCRSQPGDTGFSPKHTARRAWSKLQALCCHRSCSLPTSPLAGHAMKRTHEKQVLSDACRVRAAYMELCATRSAAVSLPICGVWSIMAPIRAAQRKTPRGGEGGTISAVSVSATTNPKVDSAPGRAPGILRSPSHGPPEDARRHGDGGCGGVCRSQA